MNLFDITLLLILAFFVVKGLIRGIILELFSLVGMIVAYVLALRQVEWAAAVFAGLTEMPAFVATALGFTAIFITVIIVFRIIAVVLHKIVKSTPIDALNRSGGAVFGVLKGLLVASLVAHLIVLVPVEEGDFAEQRNTSWFLEPSKAVAPFLFNMLKHLVPQTKSFSDELQEGVNQAMKQTRTKVMEEVQDQIEEKINETLNEETIEEQFRDVLDTE